MIVFFLIHKTYFHYQKNIIKILILFFVLTFCYILPSIDLALKNLIKATKKYCIIRTLVSENTHLNKFYHNDKTNKNNILTPFSFKIHIVII